MWDRRENMRNLEPLRFRLCPFQKAFGSNVFFSKWIFYNSPYRKFSKFFRMRPWYEASQWMLCYLQNWYKRLWHNAKLFQNLFWTSLVELWNFEKNFKGLSYHHSCFCNSICRSSLETQRPSRMNWSSRRTRIIPGTVSGSSLGYEDNSSCGLILTWKICFEPIALHMFRNWLCSSTDHVFKNENAGKLYLKLHELGGYLLDEILYSLGLTTTSQPQMQCSGLVWN